MKKLADLGLPGATIKDPLGGKFSDIGSLINALLPYVFGVLGLVFLFVLISGGFDLLLSGGNPEKVQSGQKKITNGLIGLIVVMAAYWIAQIIEVVFGVRIVG